MIPARILLPALAPALLLAGCGGGNKAADPVADKPQAVLPGSVSDAMIDLDKSQAQAPLGGSGKAAPSGAQAAAERALLGTTAKDEGDDGDTAPDKPVAAASAAPAQAAPSPSASMAAPRPAPSASPSAKPAAPKAAASKSAAKLSPPKPKATSFPKPGDEN